MFRFGWLLMFIAPVAASAQPTHWAFRPPEKPAVPAVQHASWVQNPVDAFLAAEWEKRGLEPAAPASKRLLLRRVYLDLIGLPPTLDEIDAFLKDDSINAYEKVVDRLLSSKQYGERWARHWMDVWRYSDWWGLGAEVRNSQKHMWHWRDWIIESLNDDKGYDQMIREMLAADELYPDDLHRIRATGFLARQYFIFNRNTWLDETVEHTAKAFLGLTINCCKCHEHKYDPFAQADYYRFRAFFEPYQVRTEMAPGEADFAKNGIPRVFDCNHDTPTFLFAKGDEKRPEKDKPVAPGLPSALWSEPISITPVKLPTLAHRPDLRPHVLENYLRQAEQQIASAKQVLAKSPTPANNALLARAEFQPKLLQARAAADRAKFSEPPLSTAKEWARTAAKMERQAAILDAEVELAKAEGELAQAAPAKRAETEKKRATAIAILTKAKEALGKPGESYTSLRGALKTLESNLESEASRNKPFPTTSTGRRSALAKWITDARNPLTARVAVNHIWLRHFGKPLVSTVFEFGKKGARPTHPELLDFLAVELRDHGWSMKYLHKLLVMSNAYRLGGNSNSEWRREPQRMEAQVVRDSLLHLAGELDDAMGGPSIPAAQETRRRSLYFFHSHNEHNQFLSMFDDAPVLECYRRSESIVPQQALALENSKFTLTMAEKIADRLQARLPNSTDAEYIHQAFCWLLGTEPTAQEMATCLEAVAELRAGAASQADVVRRACRASSTRW